MSNRAQRRAYDKSVPSVMRGKTRDQKIAMLCKNGITPEQLEKEHHDGFALGYKTGAEASVKTVYAAVMLAASSEFGFGKDRALRLIQAVDERIVTSLDSEEAINDVWKRFGIKISFSEGVSRVEQSDK